MIKLNLKCQNYISNNQYKMRKNSKSLRKSSPKKNTKKKDSLKKEKQLEVSPINLQSSLYRKYSTSQNYYYASILSQHNSKDESLISTQHTEPEQCLEKYHNSISRKHVFFSLKEIYRMHKQIPKIYQTGIKQILQKCYHRKRLLEYFKIAKVLGIKVECGKFSTFLLSANDYSMGKICKQKSFDPIIPKISYFDFSQEVEKQILFQMQGKQNDKNVMNR